MFFNIAIFNIAIFNIVVFNIAIFNIAVFNNNKVFCSPTEDKTLYCIVYTILEYLPKNLLVLF